ncbi:MerR family transcriptional regulator [Paenirhodobacter populi]|uniref:DNA-binding protein n=1 Tax=Paenirhodobacter populi TaxID=2306993 RepID=A0A443IPG2_9RHOB|nr:DNA-binding protein [Sinirhodobacter populi]RWR08479.1 DNA-binding protein [Sinirhodobacter populi]
MDDKKEPDLLYGIGAIASHLGVRARQALYLKEKGEIPTFKVGKTICARRSLLDAWLEEAAKGGRANG